MPRLFEKYLVQKESNLKACSQHQLRKPSKSSPNKNRLYREYLEHYFDRYLSLRKHSGHRFICRTDH